MDRSPRRRRRRTAFTLVELLIVIVVMVILASMLYMAAAAAYEYAKLIKCQAQLEQIAAAVRAYATKFNGEIPPAKFKLTAGADADCPHWVTYLVRTGCLAQDRACQDSTDDPTEGSSVLVCPSAVNEEALYTDTITYPDDAKARGWYHVSGCAEGVFSTYYWNGCTVRPANPSGPDAYLLEFPSLVVMESDANRQSYLHNISEIRRQSTMAMVMDGVWMDGHAMPARIAARHAGDNGPHSKTNIAYYDGHVEAMDRVPGDDKKWTEDPIMNRKKLGGGPPYFRIKDQVITLPAK
jgi:prepilin-type N-terminal cleavage/methylation domain-containing protein/prepilin-type processing-associated H-X9-DG protein